MSLSTSPDEKLVAEAERIEPAHERSAVEGEFPSRFVRLSRTTFVGGIVLVAALFALGGWQRRWIADDGLIVLRTVRNLLAGNGPVFNAGERVETNTSTAWTYIVWFFSWVTQARLEYVVLGIALVLSVLAVTFAMLGTGRLWGGTSSALLLPAGVLVYIALPPARDYATSGLENCLVICWIGLLWWLLLRWSQAARPRVPALLGLVFLAGLAPLIRPEMTVVGGLALLLIWLAPMPESRWRPTTLRLVIVAVAGFVPLAYQVFRMGYYGLPYPNTAVAKDAGGAKWGQGFTYLWDLVGPYFLWVPLLTLLAVGAVATWGRRPIVLAGLGEGSGRERLHRVRKRLRSPSAVVALVLFAGALLTVYALRVGGDFMHGRMLLPQLFLLLLPVMVFPVRVPALSREGLGKTIGVPAIALTVVVVWALLAMGTTAITTGTKISRSGIVDERVYYVLNTGHDHPILAEHYLDYARIRPMVEAIEQHPDGGLLLNSPSFMFWHVVPPPLPIPEGGAGHTVYFLNLGMTSMNVPLNVRVLDPMGLAYPLAAHTDRLTDGRIGHDKSLYSDWVIVDTGMVDRKPWMPWYMDEKWVDQARVAMSCPDTIALQLSYREPLGWKRFAHNLRNALRFASYRIDRVPKYEIQRCGLVDPHPSSPR
ncbi:flagellar motor control protein ZomB [Nocardia paucivorans]|uniref:flagellar motor control protein ZomB n=1 Tax=Nocardia paucivorans TaxID=114259 RepID=UPI0002D7A1E4|nr:flagellar motor control protein ZomB [Nocardia paucivorans]